MKIIRISFKVSCPECKYQNNFDIEKTWTICDNCGYEWDSTNRKLKDLRVFKDSPFPQGYDRRIRS